MRNVKGDRPGPALNQPWNPSLIEGGKEPHSLQRGREFENLGMLVKRRGKKKRESSWREPFILSSLFFGIEARKGKKEKGGGVEVK